MISQTSRAFAAGVFIVGLVLMGFGFMIFLLPRFFATLAALVFFVAGLVCAATSTRIFMAQRKLDQMSNEDSAAYRSNVRVRIEEYQE
jgi:protein-S-isoprenylcysteine O-methyltransferase Ste14